MARSLRPAPFDSETGGHPVVGPQVSHKARRLAESQIHGPGTTPECPFVRTVKNCYTVF